MVTHSFLGNPARVAAIIAVLILAYTFMTGPESLVGSVIRAHPAVPQIEIPGGPTDYTIGETVSVLGGNLAKNHVYSLKLGDKFIAYVTTDNSGAFSYTFELTESLSSKSKDYETMPLYLMDDGKVTAIATVKFFQK